MAGKTSIKIKGLLLVLITLLYGVAMTSGTESLGQLILPSAWDTWMIRPWSIVTYGFVHLQWLHFVVNLFLLAWLTLSVCVGYKELWGLFITGTILGGLIFLVAGDGVLMGASSGIAAIVPVEVFRRWGGSWGLIILNLWVFCFEFLTRGTLGGLIQSIHMVGYVLGIFYVIAFRRRLRVEGVNHEALVNKVNVSGYNSLSKTEREQLKQMGV